MTKPQVGGDHYASAIQPIEYITKNDMPYCEGNIIKYISRHAKKNGAEDVKKAIHYALFILKNEYGTIDDEDIEAVLANLEAPKVGCDCQFKFDICYCDGTCEKDNGVPSTFTNKN